MRDLAEHPDYLELAAPRYARMKVNLMAAPAAIGVVTYRDTSEVAAECALVHDAGFAETFMTSASPGIVVSAMENRYYPSREEYVRAVADALATEYRFIVEQGLLLQIDAPDLAMERHTLFADEPLDEFLAWVELVVEATNQALIGIDPGRVRLHVCWGNYEGPHTRDVALADILPLLYKARVGALVLSMANARHAHEHACFAARAATRRHGARRRRDRHDEQLRGAPGGGGGPHRARRERRRRPATRHRDHRLRVRHLCRHRRRGALGGLGEAARDAVRRGPRDVTPLLTSAPRGQLRVGQRLPDAVLARLDVGLEDVSGLGHGDAPSKSRLRSTIPAAHGSANFEIQRSWISRIGTGLR